MRTFSCSSPLQDAGALPWVWELPPIPNGIPVWGVNIVPTPIYASYDENGQGVGEILSYEWSALLDPADTPLPDWITETTPPPAPELKMPFKVKS